MSGIDPIYEFKQHFNDRDAQLVVRSVIQHRKIWERFINDHLIEDLIHSLPHSVEFWIAPYICLVCGEKESEKVKNFESAQNKFFALESQQSNLEDIHKENWIDHEISLENIAFYAASIGKAKERFSCWEDLFSTLKLTSLRKNQILEGWGTIFSIIYCFSSNRKQLVLDWGNSELSVLNDILAFVVSANPVLFQQDQGKGNILEGIHCENIVKTLSAVRSLGNYEETALLADAYLKNHDNEANEASQEESGDSIDESLSQIKHYKNLALIATFSSQPHRVNEIGKKIVTANEKLNQRLAQLDGQIKKKYKEDGIFSEQNTESTDKIENNDYLLTKIRQAASIEEIDRESAVLVLREVSYAILTADCEEEILQENKTDFDLASDQLIQRMLNLGMIEEAAEVSEKILQWQPANIKLLRASANLYCRFGDYTHAAELFTQLDLISDTTREERICWASCLEKEKNWKQALLVWQKINLVNQEELFQKAICAFKADNLQVLKEISLSTQDFKLQEKIYQLLIALINAKRDSKNQVQEIVDKCISDHNIQINEARFLVEYLYENSQFESALELIKKLTVKEQNNPEIAILHYDILNKLGDVQICNAILENVLLKNTTDIVLVEQLLERCFRQKFYGFARKILKAISTNWVLSPMIMGFKARLLIEEREFSKSKRILEKLIRRREPKRDWVLDYGLTFLGCAHEDFPLDINSNKDREINISDSDLELFSRYSDDLEIQIVHAELNRDERLPIYQSLLNKKEHKRDPQIWKIYAGIAQVHYFSSQYDLALINFKEALNFHAGNKLVFIYLVRTFLKMNLVDDALEIIGTFLDHSKLSTEEWLVLNQCFEGIPRWLDFVKNIACNHPADVNMQIGLSDLLARNNDALQVIKTIAKLESEDRLGNLDKFICAQIMIRVDQINEAKRFIEMTLSAQENIAIDELSCSAILYAQINEFQKALNLLNLMHVADPKIQAIKATLFLMNNQKEEAYAAINSVLNNGSDKKTEWLQNFPEWLQIPEFLLNFQENPAWIIKTAVQIQLSDKNVHGALEDVKKGMKIYPDSICLKNIALELAKLIGDQDLINKFLTTIPEVNSLGSEACIWAEAALSDGQEILAANLLSDLIRQYPETARIKALQARLLIRNGNDLEAIRYFNEIVKNKQEFSQGSNTLAEQNNLWVAELAIDLGKYHEACLISKELLGKFGTTQALIKIFLISLCHKALGNWINKKLNVSCHLTEITVEDKNILESIRDSSDPHIAGEIYFNELMDCINVFMTEEEESMQRILSAESIGLQQIAKLIAQYRLEGRNIAQIAVDSNPCPADKKFVMVLLDMEKEPNEAMVRLTELMREMVAQPQHYACLAYLHTKLDQIEDAYAAINLALVHWPDEYQWQILAGDLSKAKNNLLDALDHYQKAKEIKDEDSVSSRIEALHLQAGNPNSIAYLEKKIQGNEKDYPLLISLSELYIKIGKYQKAVQYLEQARHYQPLKPQPFILMCQVAEKIGNLQKAEEIIHTATRLHPSDEQVMLQKERLTKRTHGKKAALDFLNSWMEGKEFANDDLAIEKASLLSENYDDETALKYLVEVQGQNGSVSLNLEIVEYYLKLGKISKAEELAEKLQMEQPSLSSLPRILADISRLNGDLDKAVDLMIKAIQLDPLEPNTYIELSKIYQSKRDYDQAETILRGGIKTNPHCFSLLSSLGLLYYQQGKYQEAESYLRQARKEQPRNEEINRILSTIENANTNQASHKIDMINQDANLYR